jgi:hypothetical protein
MTKQYFEVTVEYSGTKTFRVPIQDGEPAATIGYIGENYYRLEQVYNPISDREETSIVSIIRGEDK